MTRQSSLKTKVYSFGAPVMVASLLMLLTFIHSLVQIRRQVTDVDVSAEEAILLGDLARAANGYERNFWELLSVRDREDKRELEENGARLDRDLREFLRQNEAVKHVEDIDRARKLLAELSSLKYRTSEVGGLVVENRLSNEQLHTAVEHGLAISGFADSCSQLAKEKEEGVATSITALRSGSATLLWSHLLFGHEAQIAASEASWIRHLQRTVRRLNAELADAAEYRVRLGALESPEDAWQEFQSAHHETEGAMTDLQRASDVDLSDTVSRDLTQTTQARYELIVSLMRQQLGNAGFGVNDAAADEELATQSNLLNVSLDEHSTVHANRLRNSTAQLRRTLAFAESFIIMMSLAFLAAAAITVVATRKGLVAIHLMTEVTGEIARGRLDARVAVSSMDELGRLGAGLNNMAESLQAIMEEHRRGQERLQLQAAALDAAANAILITQVDGTIVWGNEAFKRLTGYDVLDVIGQTPSFLKSNEQPRSFYKGLWETITAGQVWHSELINRRKDGGHYTEEMTITPVTASDGNITHFIAIKQDVTARNAAEKTLRRSDERFKLVVQATKDQIWDWDPSTGAMWRSGTFWEHFGHSDKNPEPDVSVWDSLVHPDDRERVWDEYKVAVTQHLQFYESEYRFRRGDGSYATVVDRAYILYNENGTPTRVIGAMTDISESRRLEEQARQMQKLEAVGKLAGGIAHDFNNLLMIITSSGQLMQMHLGGNAKASRDLDRILKAADRAAGLTQQLLAFSRKQVLAPRVVDVNASVSETIGLLKRTIGEDIDVAFLGGQQVPPILADPGQMCQVVMNLCVNARDAMPQGGKLTIQTRAVTADTHYCRMHPGCAPGQYAAVSVTDTGKGMSKEVQQHLFDPFFTTKDVGNGTGLGLATVYGIVRQSGGYISVYSEVGKGSTFQVLFPATRTSTPIASKEDHEEVLCAGETVMLVEDEDSLREAISDFLNAHGYTVIRAAGGAEALEILESSSAHVDILLTDVVMPKMSGRQLAEAALSKSPTTRVVYMSGYTDDAIVRHGVLEAKAVFLQKPFSLADLAAKLRQAAVMR